MLHVSKFLAKLERLARALWEWAWSPGPSSQVTHQEMPADVEGRVSMQKRAKREQNLLLWCNTNPQRNPLALLKNKKQV